MNNPYLFILFLHSLSFPIISQPTNNSIEFQPFSTNFSQTNQNITNGSNQYQSLIIDPFNIASNTYFSLSDAFSIIGSNQTVFKISFANATIIYPLNSSIIMINSLQSIIISGFNYSTRVKIEIIGSTFRINGSFSLQNVFLIINANGLSYIFILTNGQIAIQAHKFN